MLSTKIQSRVSNLPNLSRRSTNIKQKGKAQFDQSEGHIVIRRLETIRTIVRLNYHLVSNLFFVSPKICTENINIFQVCQQCQSNLCAHFKYLRSRNIAVELEMKTPTHNCEPGNCAGPRYSYTRVMLLSFLLDCIEKRIHSTHQSTKTCQTRLKVFCYYFYCFQSWTLKQKFIVVA